VEIVPETWVCELPLLHEKRSMVAKVSNKLFIELRVKDLDI
jgi:hypothetical protein